MTDISQNIKDLQLKIWLSRSPSERLKQFMEDNASLFRFWEAVRTSDSVLNPIDTQQKDKNNSLLF
jgi:hypothetical protein